MPGPPPKHPSRRRRTNDPKSGFSSLPAEGRGGDAPEWPLQPDVAMTAELDQIDDRLAAIEVELESAEDGRTKGRLRRQQDQLSMSSAVLRLKLEQAGDAERLLWVELWGSPQAVMWDESVAFARAVAQFVRWNIRAEQGDLKAAPEARLRGQELGLTPLSLMRLRREVEETEAAVDRGEQRRGRGKPSPTEDKKGDSGDDPRNGLYAVS